MSSSDSSVVHEALMIGLSVLSAIFSGSMIFAYASIPAVRKKKYFELVFYIAVGNFLSSVGSSIGFVPDKSVACWFEGVLTNVFSLSSIAWTVVIAISMNYIVMHEGTTFDIGPGIHTICWLLPVFITFIPLIEVRMGSEGGDFWCFYVKQDDAYEYNRLVMWRWIGNYFWIIFSVALTIGIYMILLLQMKAISRMITHKAVMGKLLDKLKYYPLIILICWFPGAIYDSRKEHQFDEYSNIPTTVLNCIHGILLGTLFWAQNYQTIAKLWRESQEGPRISSNDIQVHILSEVSAPSTYVRDSDSTMLDRPMSSVSERSLTSGSSADLQGQSIYAQNELVRESELVQLAMGRLPNSISGLSTRSFASQSARSPSGALDDIDELWH